MSENNKLIEIFNGCCEMEDSTFRRKCSYLSEIASFKQIK